MVSMELKKEKKKKKKAIFLCMALNGMYVDFKSYCKKLKSICKNALSKVT